MKVGQSIYPISPNFGIICFDLDFKNDFSGNYIYQSINLSIYQNTLFIPGGNCFVTVAPCKHRREKNKIKYIRKEVSTLSKIIKNKRDK